MSCDNHSFCIKILESAESFLIYAYGFTQCHMLGVTVYLHGFAVIMQFIVYVRDEQL